MSVGDVLGGDPAPGLPAEVHDLASAVRRRADQVTAVAQALGGTIHAVGDAGLSGPVADGVGAGLGALVPQVAQAAEGLDAGAAALDRYAAELEQLQLRARGIADRAEEAAAALADADAALDGARDAVERARASREEAEQQRDRLAGGVAVGEPGAVAGAVAADRQVAAAAAAQETAEEAVRRATAARDDAAADLDRVRAAADDLARAAAEAAAAARDALLAGRAPAAARVDLLHRLQVVTGTTPDPGAEAPDVLGSPPVTAADLDAVLAEVEPVLERSRPPRPST